jgi:transcriptional regulator with XRE-family HTH domain
MLSRKSIRRIFDEHRGTAARIANELGVSRAHVSRWLSGHRDSSTVAQACRAEAERLLRGEGKPVSGQAGAKTQGHKMGRRSPSEGR